MDKLFNTCFCLYAPSSRSELSLAHNRHDSRRLLAALPNGSINALLVDMIGDPLARTGIGIISLDAGMRLDEVQYSLVS